jgi:hypothetical protein
MDSIKVKKAALLKILRKNRAEHRQIFEEAIEGYRKAVIKEFEHRLNEIKAGKKIDVIIRLQQPQDQTKDYDRVIGMLEMSVDDVVELDEQSYKQYVMDDWSWTNNFLSSNSTYSVTAAGKLG